MNFSKLIYENKLASPGDVKDFVMEGEAALSFPKGRLRLESLIDESEGQRSNFVFWCPNDFPADLRIEWDFYPISEPGLCIMFFCASGKDGLDLFDETLQKRTGEYQMYHSGDINAYHISYFRRRWPQERAFHTCNLRKSFGFHLVAQGADPIPDVADCAPPYRTTIEKCGGNIAFYINDLLIFTFADDGRAYGGILPGGKIGFRQMAPLIAEYANLKIYAP